MSKKKTDEGFKIVFNFISSDNVTPAEIRLIENQLGELLQQIIRETDQEE